MPGKSIRSTRSAILSSVFADVMEVLLGWPGVVLLFLAMVGITVWLGRGGGGGGGFDDGGSGGGFGGGAE